MALTASDIRRNYSQQLDQLLDAEAKRDAIKLAYDAEFAVIEASRRGKPGRVLSNADYISRKIKLGNIESDLARAQGLVNTRKRVFHCLPTPKPRRPRKTVLVDGVRTKIEREFA
jgi:hypothetical protein